MPLIHPRNGIEVIVIVWLEGYMAVNLPEPEGEALRAREVCVAIYL